MFKIVLIREKIINFFRYYSALLSEVKCKAKTWKRYQNSWTNALKITNGSCTRKSGNTSENLLSEIRKVIYSLQWAKEITKKVYHNIIKSMKL